MAKKLTPVKKPKMKEEVKTVALKDMTVEELKNQVEELSSKIAQANLEKATGKSRNLRAAFNLRRERARALTVLNIKKMS